VLFRSVAPKDDPFGDTGQPAAKAASKVAVDLGDEIPW
jgi:hypothetical protein